MYIKKNVLTSCSITVVSYLRVTSAQFSNTFCDGLIFGNDRLDLQHVFLAVNKIYLYIFFILTC